MTRIYADNAATTKMSKAAITSMLAFLEDNYGNPSSLHIEGQNARKALNGARDEIASCLDVDTSEIYFTSGGSESDNQAIMTGAVIGAENGKRHIISQKTEHNAVLNTLKRLEKTGFEIELLDVDKEGFISPEQVENALRNDTALVSIMTANNEIGTVMPISKIAGICREHHVLFHTDAVQAAGHIPINVNEINCDMLSLSAHKFHGAKGVGALYIRKGIKPYRLISGGGQENGARAGTENVAGITAMAAALKESTKNIPINAPKISAMRDRLVEGLSKIPRSVLNGSKNNRLPGNVNFCFEGAEGEALTLLLGLKGICASTGSACSSGSLEASHVLLAIGRSEDLARCSLRLTLSEENTFDEIDYIIRTVKVCVGYLRSVAPNCGK